MPLLAHCSTRCALHAASVLGTSALKHAATWTATLAHARDSQLAACTSQHSTARSADLRHHCCLISAPRTLPHTPAPLLSLSPHAAHQQRNSMHLLQTCGLDHATVASQFAVRLLTELEPPLRAGDRAIIGSLAYAVNDEIFRACRDLKKRVDGRIHAAAPPAQPAPRRPNAVDLADREY